MTTPRGWRSARWLTTTEAAKAAGLSRSRLYQLTHHGTVPVVRDHRGRQRIRPADLIAWMERQGQEAEPLDLFTFADGDARAEVVAWLASVADPDGVIRDPEAVAMIRETLADD